MVDIVPNHSSNLQWFKAALAEPGSPGVTAISSATAGPNGDQPTTNWENHSAARHGPACPTASGICIFTKEQPDWNWNNREVRDDFLGTLRSGSITAPMASAWTWRTAWPRILTALASMTMWSGANDQPEDGSHPVIDRDEVHDIYHEWRKVVQSSAFRFAVADRAVRPEPTASVCLAGRSCQIFNPNSPRRTGSRRHAPGHRGGLEARNVPAPPLRETMSNHDVIRHATRYALPQVPTGEYHRLALEVGCCATAPRSKRIASSAPNAPRRVMMEMALPGSAYMYQGEELGLFEVADIPSG